jgi:hypothetical protein
MASRRTTMEPIVNDDARSSTSEPELNNNTVQPKQTKANSFLSPTGLTSLISFVVLSCAYISGFMSRLFSVIRFESIIHEFDPWFNYRSTAYMTENGFYNFLNWFDELAWYPLGRIVGGTVYPGNGRRVYLLDVQTVRCLGLMLTSGVIHWFLHMINIPIHIREICVFLAPFFSGLTALATYLFTKELWSRRAGLFAAAFIAIAPGYSSRSVAGSYDNEGTRTSNGKHRMTSPVHLRHCHLCPDVHLLPLDSFGENRQRLLVIVHGALLFLHGKKTRNNRRRSRIRCPSRSQHGVAMCSSST